MAKKVKFANKEDTKIIHDIVERLKGLELMPEDFDYLSLGMDLSATHANGCPLRLEDLLKADKFNLLHDLMGIRNHINRKTGKLEGFFLPRFAKR